MPSLDPSKYYIVPGDVGDIFVFRGDHCKPFKPHEIGPYFIPAHLTTQPWVVYAKQPIVVSGENVIESMERTGATMAEIIWSQDVPRIIQEHIDENRSIPPTLARFVEVRRAA